MLYNALLSLTAFMFCLSLFLVHRASVLENDFRKLQGDIMLQLNQPRSEGVNGKMAKMSKTREVLYTKLIKLKYYVYFPLLPVPTSFLQLRPNTNKQPDIRGKTKFKSLALKGSTISQKENRIVVQEDGYYLVFGQVLFESPSTVMAHVIRSWSSSEAGKKSTQLLCCMREMSDKTYGNTCYSSGTVYLLQGDELELVIPDRPGVLISTDTESTFFGVIQLN
uniref:THD domain-containing protein n=1 Tax=Amphiprion percula TaxID=161767 RepID=A0A3P8T2V4_AMPPE